MFYEIPLGRLLIFIFAWCSAKFDASKDKANFKKVDVVSSSLPSGRYGHSAFLQQSESRARMIVFGGYDQDGSPNNEMWSLEVQSGLSGRWSSKMLTLTLHGRWVLLSIHRRDLSRG
jgi:hypothetical protein